MSKVTSVEPQKKNPKRFNVFLDGKFGFGADEDLIVNFRLVPGKEVQKENLEKIIFEAEVGKVMERMYDLFSRRARSEREIRDYFRRKNFEARVKEKEEKSEIVIDAVIETLKKKGLLNDKEFARSWVQSRRNSKKKGSRALIAELYQKGIDKEIVEEVITEELGGESEEDIAKAALSKKVDRFNKLPETEGRQKATEFLLRRGFDYSVVRKVVNELIYRAK